MEVRTPITTVCICTYNRAVSLRRTLESLQAMKQPENTSWELLIIDNNSADATESVARDFDGRLPLRYIYEPDQGLSHGRNRACRECRGDLLIFTDDDIVFDSGWFVGFLKASEKLPDVDYFGGRLLPRWEQGRPTWVHDEDLALLSGLFGKYELGTHNRRLTATDPLPFGGSFAIRRELFERLTPFRVDLGVSGTSPGRGEEADYLTRARKGGALGAYVAEAVAHHCIDPKKLRLGYLYQFGIQKGIAEARVNRVSAPSARTRALSFLAKGLFQLAKGRGDRFRQCVINMGIQVGLRRE